MGVIDSYKNQKKKFAGWLTGLPVLDKPPGTENLKNMTLRYDGLFDFDTMYAAIIDWAKNYGYIWVEQDYKHKPSANGAEKEWKWVMKKKVTSYVHYRFLLSVHTWDLREVQVDIGGGKKRSLTNARIEIIIQPTIQFDWQGKFGVDYEKDFNEDTTILSPSSYVVKDKEGNPRLDKEGNEQISYKYGKKPIGRFFAPFLGKLYWRVMKQDMENIYADQLYYRAWNLHALIKKYFDMQTKHHAYKRYMGEN